MKWKLQNRPKHLATKATENDENSKQCPKKLVWMKSDNFWIPTFYGDVNFSGQTKTNSKTQIHKSVLFMYRNVK